MTRRLLDQIGKKGRELLVRHDGPLTRDLLQEPARFGLGRLPKSRVPDQTTNVVCGFCSTGCGLTVHLRQGEAIGLTPTTDYPVNLGMACPKGWEALTPLRGPGRATDPMIKRDGRLVPVSWEDAVYEMADRFKSIQAKHGPESVAWIGTGQMVTEELAFLGALGKFGMGMIHGDGNTRQCMATAATAYKQSFGFDAPPFTYKDFEESDVIVLVGSNLCIAHPIMWERVCKNPNDPSIIVIDPRMTETAMAATHHYAIKPKGDLALFYGIAHCLIEKGWYDREYVEEHTSNFAEFKEQVKEFTLRRAAEGSGVEAHRIEALTRLIAQGKRVSFWWTMGVNQSHEGVRTAQAIIAVALLTKNIGRPGTGANSITGQCNAMGSRLFSNTTTLLGGRDFTNPEHRAEVASILGIDVAKIPSVPSLAYDQIVEGIAEGKIKGLWVLATNPAHSWIDQNRLMELLSKLDCLVVQDMYSDTETAQLADVLLPAAAWGEKEGTFINSERRIGVAKRVARAPGQALADFHIFRLVAEAWGCGDLLREWQSPEAVFQILKRLSSGKPCDITGIDDYVAIDAAGGIQWPYAKDGGPLVTERRLFADGRFFTADGKARLFFEEPRPLPEQTSEEFPFVLLTGRGSSSQWHTQTRTKRSDVLRRLAPTEIYVEISHPDAKTLSIAPDEMVVVRSKRAAVEARAFVTRSVKPGQVFVPMHYDMMNRLTFAAFDPYSRQPAYKACAVRIEKRKSG